MTKSIIILLIGVISGIANFLYYDPITSCNWMSVIGILWVIVSGGLVGVGLSGLTKSYLRIRKL